MDYSRNAYIAGPMRGIPEFNFPAFFVVGDYFERLGYNVFNPARHDVKTFGDTVWKGRSGDESELEKDVGFDIRTVLRDDLVWIAENAGVIVLLPGHENSKGAAAELALARALGIKEIEVAQEVVDQLLEKGYVSPD